MEKFGTGLERIRAEFDHAGYPPPEFDYSSLGFSLVLRNDPYTGERLDSLGLNERQIAAVNYLKTGFHFKPGVPKTQQRKEGDRNTGS
ncbi:hypothetical protein [Methanoculleus sp. 7T]|uniref:hypothetical protein n=1 Tax=Methanoculleus sp. 7T TaxID=2937282 RepID=UPI0020C12740|nr:hypothetical protein [Methanoculleus sp. 7T]MCK8519635.1 hypothetical protein [Methanoculleus sp. 7T]